MHLPGYQILRTLKRGGMSTVYLGIQQSVGREVALKVMSPALDADPRFHQRFQREAGIVGQLSHPNIVAVYDIGRHEHQSYIAMEYLAGGSLRERINSGVDAGWALRLIRQVALALGHAHERGFIHRDIKPDNILLRQDGSAVLSDFGVARAMVSTSPVTQAGTVIGTPYYMSPEQARGQTLDARADLYALGILLYEMLSGQVPYRGEDPVAVAIQHMSAELPELPSQYAALQPLLRRLLAKQPSERWQSSAELVEAIDALLNPTAPSGALPLLTATQPSGLQLATLLRAVLSLTAQTLRQRLQLRLQGMRHCLPERRAASPALAETDAQQQTRVSAAVAGPPASNAHRRLALARRPLLVLAIGLGIWLAFAGMRSEDAPLPAPPSPITAAQTATGLQTSENVANVALDNLYYEVRSAADSTLPAPEPEPARYALTVEPDPARARVRIMNIRERYQPGIELAPGDYQIEVSHPGYDTRLQWISLDAADRVLPLKLRPTPRTGSLLRHPLAEGGEGPSMVVVPAGQFTPTPGAAKDSSDSGPIAIRHPFAVSQHEISFDDYSRFASASGRPLPDDRGWGRGRRPVINLSWDDARAYVDWLRRSTGHPYRLPTAAEWEYVARAGSYAEYFWEDGDAEGPHANCRRGCRSPFANLFGARTAPTGSFAANPWRLFDTAGNVAEWVQDCFQRDAGKSEVNNTSDDCSRRVVRGGSIRSSYADLRVQRREHRAAGRGYHDVGLRVVVELY